MTEPVAPISQTDLQARLSKCFAVPLGPPVRQFMERRFGADFSDVKVRTGPAAASLCRSLEARAFTSGSDIAFDAGESAPASPAGRLLIAHELAHVLQQRAGKSGKPSPLVPIGDHRDDWEGEADRLAGPAAGSGLRPA